MNKTDYLDRLKTTLETHTKFTDEAWNAAQGSFELNTFDKKQNFFSAGDSSDKVHFLLDGLARFYYTNDEGKERIKSFGKPFCSVTSLPSLIDGSPAPFGAQAITDCTCLTINYSLMKELNAIYPCWAKLTLSLFEQLVKQKDIRIEELLMRSASERYLIFLEEYGALVDLIPNYQIASYLGITEVALSRIRGKMKLT